MSEDVRDYLMQLVKKRQKKLALIQKQGFRLQPEEMELIERALDELAT